MSGHSPRVNLYWPHVLVPSQVAFQFVTSQITSTQEDKASATASATARLPPAKGAKGFALELAK